MLVTSIFSFFQNVFKRLFLRVIKSQDCVVKSYSFPKRQFVDSSKPKEFADNSFEFDENGRNFSKWVENAMGEGEIACYKQFLLFSKCFQKSCTADM